MNDTLKAAGRIGAELGAAKAEVERMREVLSRIANLPMYHCSTENDYRLSAAKAMAVAALSQQAEPVRSPGTEDTASMDSNSAQGQFTAVDMATAAAQGFRDGQAAVEQAAAKDETEPVYQFQWREIGEGDWIACSHSWFRFCEASPERDTRVVEVTRPAQTEQQPVAINPDPPELMIRWHESPESVHRAMWESVAIREGMTYDELLAEGVTCGFDESGNEVEMEAGADIEGMRMQGCWAFVDTLNSCIHAWAAPDTDRGLVLHMLAHEISHATGTPHPDGFQEEMRAEQFGRVAALAYDMLLNKDRPKCAAPECGCADAFCMAWPDD